MNTRIRELLEQADMGYLFRKDKMVAGMVNPESLKKFAELIVQECIDTLYKNGCSCIPADRLKEHFGVKE